MPFSYTKLIRKGALKGILGGHRGWQVGLFILVVGQLLRKAVKRGSGVVTHSQKISVGEEAVIIGQMGNQSITAEEMASELGTIPYEILTGLNQRIPRVYHSLIK